MVLSPRHQEGVVLSARCSLAQGLALAALLITAAAQAQAQNAAPAHSHTPLVVDAGLSWASLLDQTLANYPSFVELAARDAEARAWSARANRWLAARPDLYLSYVSDQLLDDVGMREYQSGLEMTLWRPGERGAARSLGGAVGDEARAAGSLLRWQVAGLLRAALWDIASAANTAALARESRDVAAELSRVVERRHALGDLPLGDTLLARSALLEREAAVIDSEALFLDAERAYRSLTGLDVRPAEFAEPLTQQEDFDAGHPVLAAADAALARAVANLDLVSREVRGNPLLSVGPRQQRDPMTDFYVDSLAVTVRIPFGGASHGATEVAAAGRRVAEAQALRADALRKLELSLHEALHALDVTEHALALARERSALADQQWSMGQTAFAQGEVTLFDLLRLEETVRIARRDAAGLAVERERIIAEVNQAVGEVP